MLWVSQSSRICSHRCSRPHGHCISGCCFWGIFILRQLCFFLFLGKHVKWLLFCLYFMKEKKKKKGHCKLNQKAPSISKASGISSSSLAKLIQTGASQKATAKGGLNPDDTHGTDTPLRGVMGRGQRMLWFYHQSFSLLSVLTVLQGSILMCCYCLVLLFFKFCRAIQCMTGEQRE